jgi:MFS family permease
VPSSETRGRQLVRRFYVYQATRSVGFVSPVFTLFVLRDLSFTTLGLLSGLYSALLVVGELPTGYVGDRLGRRTSMAVAALANAASLAGFVVADTVAAYAVLYVLWAAGTVFVSGSADAWLYETLAEHLDTESFTTVRGRATAVTRWVSVVTTLAGGGLYVLDPRYPFVAATVVSLAGIPALALLPASDRSAGDESGDTARGEERADVARDESGDTASDDDQDTDVSPLVVVRRALTAPSLRWFVPYVAVVLAAVGAAETYVQPIGVDTFRATLPAALSGVPEPALLGLLYAVFTGLAAVAAQNAGRVETVLGVRGTLLAVPAVLAVVFVLPRVALVAAYPMFVARVAAGPLVTPIVNGYIVDRVASAGRATTVSAVSMVRGLARVPLVAGTGLLADRFGATAAPAALGGLLALAVVVAAVRGFGVSETERSVVGDA